jgi:amino acid permease
MNTPFMQRKTMVLFFYFLFLFTMTFLTPLAELVLLDPNKSLKEQNVPFTITLEIGEVAFFNYFVKLKLIIFFFSSK